MAITTYITEEIIDTCMDSLDSELVIQEWMGDFLASEPILASFLYSEDSDILSEVEKGLYSFLTTGIWAIIAKEHYEPSELSPKLLDEIEEGNWELYEAQKGSFREKIDVFFSNFEQEDLLALIEDMLEPDSEELVLSNEGRELIFIKSKSFLDALMNS